MLWESIPEESCEIAECTSLISDNFTLNSGGRNMSLRRAQIRSRNAQRRLNIEPLSLNYDFEETTTSSPEKPNMMSIDDISFYDVGNTSPQQQNHRSTTPIMDIGLLSPEGSPQRFTIVENTVTMIDKNCRSSIDEIDGSSMDSGYDTSSFKFPEPHILPILPISKRLDLISPRKNHLKQLQHDKFLTTTSSSSSSSSTTIKSFIKTQSTMTATRTKTTSPKSFRIFHSLSSGSMESVDDDYMELFEMESIDEEDSHFPSDLNSLISGHIKSIKTPEMKRPLVRRCLSLNDNFNNNSNSNSNLLNRARSALFEPKTPELMKSSINENNSYSLSRTNNDRCFKRPEPPSIISPIQSKRYKCEIISNDEKENNNNNNSNSSHINNTNTILMRSNTVQDIHHVQQQRPILRKSISMNESHIMKALARSSSDPDLIGDFSKPFCLPLMDGRHSDLKSISSDTLAKLIRGEFVDNVATFKIIDCRYPYEYDGGHIHGAENLYTHDQILDELVNCKTEIPIVQQSEDGPKRHILVFHCEFSSERGPKLSRFLRNHDRLRNSNTYPALHYPEIYLLHGGYKEFFETYSELCDPISYRPMLDPTYCAAYKQFRSKSKSWNGGDIKASGSANRLSKTRSRLVL